MIADIAMFETQEAGQAEPVGRHTIPVTSGDVVDDNAYLIGRPTLGRFLRFMAHQTVDGEAACLRTNSDNSRSR